tara:strand:- start:1206 stop:1445 length:240 start_codon:yes stop_codon:yes gene_type:complete
LFCAGDVMSNYSFCCNAEIDFDKRCCECGMPQKITWGQSNEGQMEFNFPTLDADFDSTSDEDELMIKNFKNLIDGDYRE